MRRLFRSKLVAPHDPTWLPRPGLTAARPPRLLIAQAPAGAGKSVFLAQWAAAQAIPTVYYRLDDQDRDGEVFAVHVAAGLQGKWPDWDLPDAARQDPIELCAELVNEAVGRGPLLLVLDQLESVLGEPYLADFLAMFCRYAPPTLSLAVGSRAPLPLEPGVLSSRVLTAADLAMTPQEVGDPAAFQETDGYPLALVLRKTVGGAWRSAFLEHLLATLPRHVQRESARSLLEGWLQRRVSLGELSQGLAGGRPGSEALRTETQQIRHLLIQGSFAEAEDQLKRSWAEARGLGAPSLVGAVALLYGELLYMRGQHAGAQEWYRRAFDADPALEPVGTHSMVAILRDQGHVDEAEALGRRCVEARRQGHDLQALAWALLQYAAVLADLGRLGEAEQLCLEAERAGLELVGSPYYGTLARAQRGVIAYQQGNATAYLKLTQEAYELARGRSPWLEAYTGFLMGGALMAWGQGEQARLLLEGAQSFVERAGAHYQLHMLHLFLAIGLWPQGRVDEASSHFETTLRLAARGGYYQNLLAPWSYVFPMLLQAMVRGVEPLFCQELLTRLGQRAVPALVELAGHADPAARKAALYPLAAIGGDEAVAALRRLLDDGEQEVRDRALFALKSLGHVQESVQRASQQATKPLQVTVLGPVEAVCQGQAILAWRTAKVRDLLAYLILSGDRPVTRDAILDALWPDSDPESAQTIFHTTLYQLRRALKPAGEVIAFAAGAYRLHRELVVVDMDRFAELLRAGSSEELRQAVALYRGDLLEGLDYPWVEAGRSRLRGQYLGALRQLAALESQAGRHEAAVGWLMLLVQADPLQEAGHLALMECYAAMGNRAAALQQYRTLSTLLDEELGVEPSREADELYRRLIQ